MRSTRKARAAKEIHARIRALERMLPVWFQTGTSKDKILKSVHECIHRGRLAMTSLTLADLYLLRHGPLGRRPIKPNL